MISDDKGQAATLSPPQGHAAISPYGIGRSVLVAVLILLIVLGPGLAALFANWWLPLIGVGGAVVANSTGIGGGVVFVPAFDRLGLSHDQIVGTSLIIQSFGMTMGAMTYLARRRQRYRQFYRLEGLSNGCYRMVVGLTVIPAVITAWLATEGGLRPDLPLKTIFKAISLTLVALIAVSEILPKPDAEARRITRERDAVFLLGIGVLGGFFVGWISIGVGELLAVYLLLRGARGSDAIGLAVIVTSATVLMVGLTTGFDLPADRTVALLVAPGALLGGFVAPYVLSLVGQSRVKWFCASFIVLSAIAV